jgi:hypothetical protein
MHSLKRKRKTVGANEKYKPKRSNHKSSRDNNVGYGVIINADQLDWKKTSLENGEFDDLDEIEGVDVQYEENNGAKVAQFKVYFSLGRVEG